MLNTWRKLALVMAIAASAGCAVALAVTAPGYPGGAPKVPLSSFAFGPSYSPQAGHTLGYRLGFSLKRTMPLTVKYVKPSGVTKVTARPAPTKWVHGDPVWKFKKVCSCAKMGIKLHMTFARSLKTGQRVKEKFVFSSRGYLPYVYMDVQQVFN